MVEREGALCVGPCGEEHQTDAILGPRRDELADDRLDGVEPARAARREREVLREHAARHVDGEHDVHALAVDLGRSGARLRPGERGDEEYQRDDPEHPEHQAPAGGAGRRDGAETGECGEADGRAPRRAAAPRPHERQQRDERQPPRATQLHAASPAARPRSRRRSDGRRPRRVPCRRSSAGGARTSRDRIRRGTRRAAAGAPPRAGRRAP